MKTRTSMSIISFVGLMIGIGGSTASTQEWTRPVADVSLVDDSLSVVEYAVLGELRNNGDVPADSLEVSVIGFDSEDMIVFVGRATTTYTSNCGASSSPGYFSGCVTPGGTAFFQALPPSELIDVDHFGVHVSAWQSPLTEIVIPVEVDGQLVPNNGNFGSHLEGTAINTGPDPIVALTAVTVFRGNSGELLEVSTLPIAGERIGGFSGGIRGEASADLSIFTQLTVDEYDTHQTWLQGIEYQGGLFRYAVAGVAHQGGYGGSQWRSSLTVNNRSGADGQIRIRFFSGQTVEERTVTIADHETAHWDDVVRGLFGVGGQAAGFVRIDSDVPLTVSARTAAYGDYGTMGQLLPTVTPNTTWNALKGGILTPLLSGDAFRTNIGFVNFSDHSCRVHLSLANLAGEVVSDLGLIDIPADSWIQMNDVVPRTLAVATAFVGEPDQCALWTYASVVDRTSHDPTTISIDPEVTIDLGPPRPRGGASGVFWSD